MPIHLSIGFVTEQTPRRQFENICSNAHIEQSIKATWIMSTRCCDNIGCCGECIGRELICIGRNNNKRFFFSVYDQDGNEVDLSGASEIVFSVSEGTRIGGNLYSGGTVYFEKKLSDGDVVIAGTGYQFLVDVDPADTLIPANRDSYWDATITNSGGSVYTVKAGIFRITGTNAGA